MYHAPGLALRDFARDSNFATKLKFAGKFAKTIILVKGNNFAPTWFLLYL